MSSFRPGTVTIRPLTIADRDACVAVENAAFANPDHRATPEKFAYRLTVCPELCMGVFVRDGEAYQPAATSSSSAAGSSSAGTLVGHIVSTRCAGPVIADCDMGVPPDWRDALTASEEAQTAASPALGHQPAGTTVGVHSLGIVPSAQGKGLGTQLMRAYLERMGQLAAAAAASPSGSSRHTRVDRVALICQDYLVKYYEKLGYTNNGPSEAQFGGGGWFDMVHDIKSA